jgi:hypothetical protein
MPFVLPAPAAASAKGKGKTGRFAWAPGQKLFGNMVAHASALRTYPDAPVLDDIGSTAIFCGFTKPEQWATAENLVAALGNKTTELANRPAVGVSEAAQAYAAANQLFVDAPDALSAIRSELWAKHGTRTSCAMLSRRSGDDATLEDFRRAVQAFLAFSQDVRNRWQVFFETYAGSASKTVALAWVLEASSLTIPGAWARRLADVALGGEAKTKMLTSPTSGAALRDFLATALVAHVGVRQAKPAAVSSSSGAAQLTFEGDAPLPAQAPVAQAELSFETEPVEEQMERAARKAERRARRAAEAEEEAPEAELVEPKVRKSKKSKRDWASSLT